MTGAPPPDAKPSDSIHGCSRRLYIYYRVPLGRLPQVIQVVRAAQAELCAALPGLVAEVLQRPLPATGDATLMEIWQLQDLPAGGNAAGATSPPVLDDAWQARIDRRLAQALAGLLASPRHVEVFEPCP